MSDTTSASDANHEEPASITEVGKGGNPVLKVLPWLVAAGAFAFIFSQSDPRAMREALEGARWGVFWTAAFAIYAALFLTDSFTVWWMYKRFHVPHIRYRDVLPARGASYLLGIFNYAAGSAAMAFYFKKKFRVGVLEGGASLLLLMLIDLGLVTVAILLGGSMLPAEWTGAVVRSVGGTDITWSMAINGLAALFGLGVIGHLVFWRAPWSWGPLERIRELPSLQGFRRATLFDYATIAAIRAPLTALYVLMHGLTAAACFILVPWARLLVYVPIQMLIAVVPISPSGLGTVNVAQRFLYEPYVFDASGAQLTGDLAEAAIYGYGIALAVAFNLPRVLIGVIALRAANRALADTDSAPTGEAA